MHPNDKAKNLGFLKSIFIAFLLITSISANAQTEPNSIGIGTTISQFQDDFGIGLDVISPYFLYSKVAVRLNASLKWYEFLQDNRSMTEWSPYLSVQLGLRSRQFVVSDKIFIYGEGGALLILPNDDFSSESSFIGGYGLFGFEFKSSERFSYFAEFGGVGTGARANQLLGEPIFSNGFISQVGFRILL